MAAVSASPTGAADTGAPTPPPPATTGDHRGQLFLVRHGRTPWAQQGRHTGRTDIALDEVGRRQATAVALLLRAVGLRPDPALVLASPLRRAWATAELAGLRPRPDADLQEWDYGGYEGLTTPQISAQRGASWSVFRDGVVPGGPGGSHGGESLAELAGRGGAVLGRARAGLGEGDVVLVGHGHALRVLAAVWLGLPPAAGEHLLLDPGSVCVLDTARDAPAIRHWNLTPALLDGGR